MVSIIESSQKLFSKYWEEVRGRGNQQVPNKNKKLPTRMKIGTHASRLPQNDYFIFH